MPLYQGFSPSHGQTLGTVTLTYSDDVFSWEILKLDWDGIHRDSIEVTSMNVEPTEGNGNDNFGNKQFIPSAYVDPGHLVLQVNHNPTQPIPIADILKLGPTDIDVYLGPATTTQEHFNALGFITDYKIDGPLDGKVVTATITIKLTDVVDNGYDDEETYDSDGAVTLDLADAGE